MSSYDFIRFCQSVISDMEWTNEKYLRFIDDYKKASVLWDIRNPDYKNNSKKRSVVAGLAQKYCVEDGALKKKIKNLRSAFHREHHRLTNRKGGSVDESRKWFAYDALRFILDVTGSCGGVKKEEASFAADESLQHQDTEEDLDFSDNANLIELPPLLPERHSPENNALNPVLVSKEEDEYDLFGRSMAMQLRKMPELTALELMQKMQLMVLNSRKQLSNKKIKMKQRITKPVHAPSTSNTNSKRTRSPSPDVSSQSTPSPCYKFEVMSPTERDPTSAIGDETDRSFTYVTTIEHADNFPVNDEIREDCTGNVPIGIHRETKRKLTSSIDPLEVKQSRLSNTSFKN
ncbi:uncharacterized protein isoform X1 [Choristoneura fumiferana]|uniref:uncharacterized protein isoform X1 n=1 Tax=Choristoneura fumiferana TaxID=7141 RepID=UPI003D153DDF